MIGHCVMTTSGAEGKYLTTLRNLAFRDEWGRGGEEREFRFEVRIVRVGISVSSQVCLAKVVSSRPPRCSMHIWQSLSVGNV